jgi:phosphofructokinase-like protein
MKKKILISTGGGDCPGLNAAIRAIVKASRQAGGWEVWGSREAFNGILDDPPDLMKLTNKRTAGIHVKGGTILRTTNHGNPLEYPVQQEDGTWTTSDRSQELIDKIRQEGFSAVINMGGDGSQRISQALFEKGLNIVGVPKTIDNDLSATDLTFGFSTAVQIATDSFDKLVTTAESHHRVMIMEVMGRDAGWIALETSISGGAEICLIPEIPYDPEKILRKINKRYEKGRGFVNIVIAEGAKPIGGDVVGREAKDIGEQHIKLGGIGVYLRMQLEELGCKPQIRTTILGHIQRGGTPIAFDRILATAMGVKAFELVEAGNFGQMASYRNHVVTHVPLTEAIKEMKKVDPEGYLVNVARSIGISFGD